MEAILQEAVSSESFVDLQDHIPLDILEQEQDTLIILNQHVLPNLEKESDPKSTRKKKRSTKTSQQSAVGVPVVSSSHGGIFVSGGMIRNIEKRLLPDLISRFAKERAVQLDANAVASENVAHYTKASSSSSKKKGGHKGKTGGKQSNTEDIDELSESAANLVPLYQLLQKLVEEYPELTEADREVRNLLENGSNLQLSWEGNQGQEATNSLLCEFCRTAMYTEDFIVKCQTSVEAEIKQLESARISKANLSRKDAATKIRNIDSAFEETFNTACYMLQSQVKFLEYVENAENVSEDDHGNVKFRDSLTNELLQGCCADFTSRLTQYCIFKNEMDSEQFGFLAGDFEEDQDRVGYMPHYCTPLDLAIRKYPPTFLSCIESGAGSDEESKTKGPLPKLREGFPGSIGVTLARQWTACGGVCYQGGTKIDEDEQKIARPGDLQKFMTHVEENCL